MTATITTADPWDSELGRLQSPDHHVISLVDQAMQLWGEIPGLKTDEDIDRASADLDDATERLMRFPAWTPAGIAAKQRLFVEMLPRWSGVGWSDEIMKSSRSILADLERMAGD